MRDELALLPADPLEALLALQSLAQAAWNDADLRLLGRKVSNILRSAPNSLRAEAKMRGLAWPVIGRERTEQLLAACWKIGEAHEIAALVSSARP